MAATPTPHDGGAGGAAPSPTPCVATGAETCNAKDDDCNGIVDDGCPGGVTTTFDHDLQLLGDSSSGTAFTDDCNDGEVLSGSVQVRTGALLSQIHRHLSPAVARARPKRRARLPSHARHRTRARSAITHDLRRHGHEARLPRQRSPGRPAPRATTLHVGRPERRASHLAHLDLVRSIACSSIKAPRSSSSPGPARKSSRPPAAASPTAPPGSSKPTRPTAWSEAACSAPPCRWVDKLSFGVARLDVVTR